MCSSFCSGCNARIGTSIFSDHAIELLVQADYMGNTPLHVAVARNASQCVRTLLQSAASPSTINNAGWTPISLADHASSTSLSALLDEYKDSVGLILDLSTPSDDKTTDMERIMEVWAKFFENSLRFVEKSSMLPRRGRS